MKSSGNTVIRNTYLLDITKIINVPIMKSTLYRIFDWIYLITKISERSKILTKTTWNLGSHSRPQSNEFTLTAHLVWRAKRYRLLCDCYDWSAWLSAGCPASIAITTFHGNWVRVIVLHIDLIAVTSFTIILQTRLLFLTAFCEYERDTITPLRSRTSTLE